MADHMGQHTYSKGSRYSRWLFLRIVRPTRTVMNFFANTVGGPPILVPNARRQAEAVLHHFLKALATNVDTNIEVNMGTTHAEQALLLK